MEKTANLLKKLASIFTKLFSIFKCIACGAYMFYSFVIILSGSAAVYDYKYGGYYPVDEMPEYVLIIMCWIMLLLLTACLVLTIIFAKNARRCFVNNNNNIAAAVLNMIFVSAVSGGLHLAWAIFDKRVQKRKEKIVQDDVFERPNDSYVNEETAKSLKIYKDLLDQGIITQEEFDRKKDSLLNK